MLLINKPTKARHQMKGKLKGVAYFSVMRRKFAKFVLFFVFYPSRSWQANLTRSTAIGQPHKHCSKLAKFMASMEYDTKIESAPLNAANCDENIVLKLICL